MAKGRPAGSANVKATADANPSRCPECGSTKRTAYEGTPNVQDYSGESNGQPYNKIVRRRCQCFDCGQYRIDRTFEYIPDPPARRKNNS